MDLKSSPKVAKGQAISLQMEDLADFTSADTTCCCANGFVATCQVNYGTKVAIVTSDSGNATPYAG